MIKKTTKIIFEDKGNRTTEEMLGGMPLSKGELVHIHNEKTKEVTDYKVKDKIIDCFLKGNDQLVEITYVLKKK
jgi:hypothetical protein